MRLSTFSSSHLSLLLASLTTFSVTSAWYLQVHNQIGFAAEAFLSSESKYLISEILEPQYKNSIGRAASWADTVRKDPYPFSYTWHFISALDDPPHKCELTYKRDCQSTGCVVQQIANQTSILESCIERVRDGTYNKKNEKGEEKEQRNDNGEEIDCQNALKWVVHFVGDVAQPLHASNMSYGGNTVKVTFNGTAHNLHDVWDRWILYAGTGRPATGFPDTHLDPYFAKLVQRIRSDSFPGSPRASWEMCDWTAEVGGDGVNSTDCAERWAQDSNRLSCSAVYGPLESLSGDLLLDSSYAEDAFPVVQLQLAKSAWRLANWLNALSVKGLKNKEQQQEEESSTPAFDGNLEL